MERSCGQELPAKSRRRGRKRGPRKEEKAEPRPQGKGKAKGEAQEAGPMPCVPCAPMVTGVSYPRYAHVFPGVPVFVPKAHGEPLVIAGGVRNGEPRV